MTEKTKNFELKPNNDMSPPALFKLMMTEFYVVICIEDQYALVSSHCSQHSFTNIKVPHILNSFEKLNFTK